MPCSIPAETIERVIAFHGHSCPGLAIGIRAAEYALSRFPNAELVAVAETDMCGVDAIQFLTDCTFGKGNFLHRDLGKMAFTFYDRNSGEGVRIRLRPEVHAGPSSERMRILSARNAAGQASQEEIEELTDLRRQRQTFYMQAELHEIFDQMPAQGPPPRPARILESLACADCGEITMESRTRRFAGKTLCIPCFEAVEQKR
ncbi:MAG: formylmethanofuran dehydrogenase [Deltaproteobacteria bacterium]|nr:formylmethanofuran dehydrogenase [Deltaproteobacteria bacterium]